MLRRMTAARRMTLEEWAELDEDDSRELVNGVLEEPEVTDCIHEVVVTRLVADLDAYLRPRGGFAFASGLGYAVRKDTGRFADVACYLAGRRPEHGIVRTPPDVIVEVVSPRPRDARRDRIDKLADYAAFGAKQYWLVDPHVRTLEIWRLDAKRRYARLAAVASGKLRRIPRLPGFVLDVDALWHEVDRLTSA